MATAAWYEQIETEQVVETTDKNRLRAFPNEDICLWVPKIDNSRVVRHSNPEQVGAMWRSFTIASLGVILAVGLLLPDGYGMLASYRLRKLAQEQQTLHAQQAALSTQESQLTSTQRLRAIAISRGFEDPALTNVHELAGDGETSLAYRQSSK
jgi:hypothetical protein